MGKVDSQKKEELEQIVRESHSAKEVLHKIGLNSSSGESVKRLKSKLQKMNIDFSHFSYQTNVKRNPENIFIENSTAYQTTLRKYYIKGNYSEQKCSICGLAPLWNGKELTLILDHINGINNDDRLENLRWVCPNCNQQLDTTRSKNCKKEKVKNYCIDCGKEILKNSVRCLECNHKFQAQQKIKNYPMSREELKKMIRTESFISIGKQYHCTDNNIRKYCIGYGLPKTKKEINSYSDEEWEKI